jgi:hypothetical protein
MGGGASRVALADLNGDGLLDLAVLASGQVLGIRLGHGGGTFGDLQRYGIGAGANDIAVVDLDSDGRRDLIVLQFTSSDFSVLLNLGGVLAAPPTPRAARTLALAATPNPAAGAVGIQFTLPTAARVHLAVRDVTGRIVAVPLNAERAAGAYTVHWDARRGDGSRVPPGVYFAEIVTPLARVARRMVVIR